MDKGGLSAPRMGLQRVTLGEEGVTAVGKRLDCRDQGSGRLLLLLLLFEDGENARKWLSTSICLAQTAPPEAVTAVASDTERIN